MYFVCVEHPDYEEGGEGEDAGVHAHLQLEYIVHMHYISNWTCLMQSCGAGRIRSFG